MINKVIKKIINKIAYKFKATAMEDSGTEVITAYTRIGGAEIIQNLVDRFYFHMDTNPNVKECRALHKESLNSANKKLFMFLSGWLGGPQLFIEAYGHPMMRRRHLPFKIGTLERDQWLLCMRLALDDIKLEASLDNELYQGFRRFADHMRNAQ